MTIKEITGILLNTDYVFEGETAVIRLFLKTKKGKIAIKDRNFQPYFYIIVDDVQKRQKELQDKVFSEGKKFKRVDIVRKRISAEQEERELLRLECANTRDVKQLRDEVQGLPGVKERKEYDIPFAKRYILDKGLVPLNETIIQYNEEREEIIKITQTEPEKLELNQGCFDLETHCPDRFSNAEKDPIIMASYVDDQKNIVWCEKKIAKEYCVKVSNEQELVQKLIEKIKECNLDIICTYNGDSFDFPYVKTRAQKFKMKVNWGVNGAEPNIRRKGMDTVAEIAGIEHVDVYELTRILARFGVINLVKYDLESVNEVLFGEKKDKVTAKEINEIWQSEKNLERLAQYNLEDSQATYRIAKEFLPMWMELARIVHLPLFEVTRSSASMLVEQLIMNKCVHEGIVLPNIPDEYMVQQRLSQSYIGGYVKQPEPGLHENLAVLDFSSLYPTIMISHNISPDTLDCGHEKCKTKNTGPSGHHFCTQRKGVLSGILEELFTKRIQYKRKLKELKKGTLEYNKLYARQYSLKILLNSFYGTMGYARFRWYSFECARAITMYSQEYVKWAAEEAEKNGFANLYSDSLTAERFVIVLNPKNLVEIKNIEKLFEENTQQIKKRGEKEVIQLQGYNALSVNPTTLMPEWKKINELIRHKTDKTIYRVNQKYGETRVTQDHSLIILQDGVLREVKPAQLNNRALIKVEALPKNKSGVKIKEIDLAQVLKKYTCEIVYKNRIKTSTIQYDKKYVWFGWMDYKKKVKLKRFIKVNSQEFESLCRLIGAYIAEGSSSTPETTRTKNGASIASSNVKWLKQLRKDYLALFINAKACIIPSTRKVRTLTYTNTLTSITKTVQYRDLTHKLQMMNGLAAVFFKELAGQKSKNKKLPYFIYNVPEKYQRILLDTYIQGDGSKIFDERYSTRYWNENFKLETKSLELVSGLSLLLTQLNQKYTINFRPGKQTHTITTCREYNKRLETKIRKEKYNGYVYDLNVKDNNNFVDACGQILLHNTDSAFLKIPPGKTQEDVKAFVEECNKKLPGTMNLEIENFYKRGIFVGKKGEGTERAAKKKYALIDYKDNLKIVGFEYVRRDWAKIAKDTQKKVLEAILKEGDKEKAVRIVKEVIQELKSGKVKKEDLVIYTQIKKEIKDYDSVGPHVAAAKKAIARGSQLEVGSIIEYIVTRTGKSVGERAELAEFVKEGNYDADYYLEHQVIPAVSKIMHELGYTEEDLLQGGKQKKLSQFG